MSKSVLLVMGPNLDQSGSRDPHIYGTETMADQVAIAQAMAADVGVAVDARQSAGEGELVALVHSARGVHDAIIINAGALTHYGWSLRDALAIFDGPIVEVHLSHPNAREPWRHRSVISSVATASITGLGAWGYGEAVRAAAHLIS